MSKTGGDARPDALRIGSCLVCRWARRVVSARGSEFWLCARATTDPERFPKYPRLPVLRCAGFTQTEPDE